MSLKGTLNNDKSINKINGNGFDLYHLYDRLRYGT